MTSPAPISRCGAFVMSRAGENELSNKLGSSLVGGPQSTSHLLAAAYATKIDLFFTPVTRCPPVFDSGDCQLALEDSRACKCSSLKPSFKCFKFWRAHEVEQFTGRYAQRQDFDFVDGDMNEKGGVGHYIQPFSSRWVLGKRTSFGSFPPTTMHTHGIGPLERGIYIITNFI